MLEEKIYPVGYEPAPAPTRDSPDTRNKLLDAILQVSSGERIETEMFGVMAKRRSTRKFKDDPIEESKISRILAAADTAPTAGNFQGFEIYHVKDAEKKQRLIGACNNQKYVNAPLVLVFCKNPGRVKFNFPRRILEKFAIQDATLAAGYSQLAAHALGLSSIWIGMFVEEDVMEVVGTTLVPSSILCLGYAQKQKYPKRRRNLDDLVHII